MQPLPHVIDAEQAVLGAILIKGDVLENVSPTITPEDFYKDSHKNIFATMVKMSQEKKPIDVLTLYERLKGTGNLLDDVGGSSYITYLTEIVPSTENVEYYCRLVKEASRKRSMIEELTRLVQEIQDGKAGVPEVISRFNNHIQKLASSCAHRLKPISAKDLEDIEPEETIWGDIIFPSCITQVNSEPGVGKTTLIYNVCLYGVLGEPFLGLEFNRKLKVLYVDVETPDWKRTNKLRTIYPESLPEDLHFLKSLNFREEYLDLLTLCKHERYDIVVLDTQSRILVMEQENDNAEANYYMGLLRQLANETGCAIVLVHHPTKGDRKGVYTGRGASAIAGAVDVVVNLEMLDEEVIQLKVDKNRVVGDYQKLLVRKAGEDRFEPHVPPDGSSHGFEKFKAQDFVLSLDDSRPWETGELIALGKRQSFSESTMKRAISGLAQSGKLMKVKHGVYEIIGRSSKGQKFTPREEKAELLNFSDATKGREIDFPEYLR
jgi:predicted ATP-dependent serine protease